MTADQETTVTPMRRIIARSLPNGDYVRVTALLRDGGDGLSPGFSVTVDGWERHGTWSGAACARNGRDMDWCGADHETAARVAPELAPVIAVHLADPDGTPMHAVANGWYFYTGAGRDYELRTYGAEYATRHGSDHDRAARALHIPAADLPTGLDRDGFERFCAALAPRWAAMADAARAALADDGPHDIHDH